MKPTLFIGSSTEGLSVARALEEHLEHDARVNLWTSDLFAPGGTTMEGLFEQLTSCEYAAIVLTPDDFVHARDKEWVGPRDNVIFELGLFMGRLGRDRTFILYDREAGLKIPTDLAGVTAVTFSGTRFRESPSASLSPVANKLRSRLAGGSPRSDLDFIRAYVGFIEPDTKLDDSYSQILSKHFKTLCAEVTRLAERSDWQRLLEVKKRLREYFEYSGRYSDGVDFGRRYVNALVAVGDQREALWTRVKHIGYLLILNGDHEGGRRELADVLASIEGDASRGDYNELFFYSYRYMSISFHRDRDSGNPVEALRYLSLASDVVDKYEKGSRKRNELEARLESNRGNLALASGDVASALAHYRQSLDLFIQLRDKEHEGIANLKIAEANICDVALRADPRTTDCLNTAELICMRLGWKEGHARVWEQRAYRALALAKQELDARVRRSFLEEAATATSNAHSLYESIQHTRGLGRAESLFKQIELENGGKVRVS